jgi:hypothetical protein
MSYDLTQPFVITAITLNDYRVRIILTQGGKRHFILNDEREPDLEKAIRDLLPLFLEKSELPLNKNNLVAVTSLKLGENKRTGPHCRIGASWRLQRGALYIETPRLYIKRHFTLTQQHLLYSVIDCFETWLFEREDDTTPTITEAELKEIERRFLEEFSR